jgi:6,7-dimethyl-8-ribityllumazine synthase
MRKKICLVVANYYPEISKNLIRGASEILKLHDIKNYKIFKVPGVLELPFVISKKINSYDGFIALGCVIKGKTPHFDFISSSAINALMQLSISYKKPIGNGIITCLNKKQALERSSVKNNKGKESTKAMFSLLEI